MNPNVTNSTSQVNDPAAHLDQPGINTCLSLPNSIQPSHLTAPHVNALPPPPIVSAAPSPNVSAAFTNAPQVPPDYSKAAAASQDQSTDSSKNSSMSCSAESNQHASSREQAFVVGPAFSLADSLEDGHKLQNVNVPQTTSNDSHQFAPVIGNMQTLSPDDFSTNFLSVSGPKVVSTQEPQICIGSVFSLADSHIEHHTGQHETENEAGHIAIDNSASQQTLLECSALHVHQQNMTISAEKEQDTVSSQLHTTLSTKQNQYSALYSALNSPVCLTSSLDISNNIQESNELLHPVTTSKNSVSVEVSSSVVTSINDAQLPVSQKNDSIITEIEKKSADVLRGEEKHEKPASLTKLQDSSSTSQMLPNACKVQEPEIVDLDIEDIDDCMLVKVDLSKHFTYGSKIHNSEVVIDDSDNDEDVTVLTKETSVSSGETSSGKCDEQKSSATSTVVVGENDPCGTTGSLSMEVEEINTEASKTNSEQTAVTYTMSSTGQTHVTSVMSTRTNTQPLSDQIYSEGSCSTRHTLQNENPETELMDLHVDDDDDECVDAPPSTVEYVSLKVLTPSQPDIVSTPVIQSMDLHVDDDDDECVVAPPSTVEYMSLKVLTPSQPDNVSTPVIQSMDLHVDDYDDCDDAPLSNDEYMSLKVLTPSQRDKNVSTPVTQSMFSSSSLLSSTSGIPVFKESYYNPFLDPAVQGKVIENTLRHSEVPLFPSHNDVRKGQVSQMIDSSKVAPTVPRHESHHLQLDSAAGEITNSKRSRKPSPKGKAMKSTTPTGKAMKSTTPTGKAMKSTTPTGKAMKSTTPTGKAVKSTTPLPRGKAMKSTTPLPRGKAMKSTTPLPRGKAIKSTTPIPKGKSAKSLTLKIKIPSVAQAQKKSPSYSDINFKTVDSSQTSTETDSSVMCKLCFMFFPSRMELVTHTWNWHRSSQFVENNLKCDKCGKCFANNSLLKLHKKVKQCTSSNTTDVDPGTMQISLDSILHTLIKQNRVSGAPEVFSSSATFRGGVEPQPSTAGLSSGSAAIDISNSTHVDVSSVLNSFTQRDSVSNYSTGVVTEAATDKHPDFVTGDKPMSEELIQEDIKPVITSSGELLQRSDGLDQVLAGGHSSVSDGHKCTTCQKMFSNSFQLSLHQQVSEGCKVARNDCVRCFGCAKTFTSSIIRYLHVLNNPECKEKADRYCNKCLHLFNSLADKQDHLRTFKFCRIYEESNMKDIVKDPLAKNVGHVEQNVKEPGNHLHPVFTACEISQPDKSPALAQENNNTTLVTDSSVPNSVSCQVSLPDSDILQQHSQTNSAGKSHSEKPKGGEASKQKPYVNPKLSATCPACKKKFATSAILILHFNESPNCRMKICSTSKVAKKISASEIAKKISASDRINVPKPVATPKSPGRASTHNAIKCGSAAVTASRNVFCDISSADRSLTCKVCGAEFISKNELTHHTEQKCRKLQNTKAVPQLKNLRIVLSRVSVMCQVCHLTFADDIKLAEHLHLNQPCQKGTSESVKRVLELKKSHLDIDALKRDGKRRSCEIVTGISNVTSTISMASTKDGCIALTEQMPAMDSVINVNLSKGIDGHISSSSSAKEQYVYDQGNINDESKGHADDSNKDELISSMSPSDEGSDMEESGSSSEEGNRDYTCKQCCKTYTSKSLFIQHNKSHHHSANGKRTHCKVCTRKFYDLTGLQAHLLQFKFCFIPLTRPLWEQKQDPQICSMCKKVLGSPKDLRKHCFKKMACRLRFVNMVLKNTKEKDNANVLPAAKAEIPDLKTVKEKDIDKVIPAADAVLAMSNTGKENCESQSANEVSSSVQDYCNPVEVDSSSSDVDIEDETSCIKISHVVSKPLIECLNCSGFFDDFQEHLLKQQSCLDFFGIEANKCPVPVPFCYECKTHFDDIGLLQLHACKGFVAYTHACQTCGLKFTSASNLHAHVQQSLTCNKTNLSSPQKKNHDSDHTFVESSAKNHQSGMFASSSAVRDVPTSSGEQFFHCLICDARFATLRLLMEHSYQHVEEIPISCDRCSITFIHYNQFVSHQAFHIRMDKEANILVERPQLSTFGASTSTDKNVKALVGSAYTDKNTRAQNSETMPNNGSACIFCHQEFGSVKAKLAHLTSNHACLAIIKYIIENKHFIHNQGGTEPCDRDSNRCEFCNQSFSDKFYHYLNSACFGRLESAILKYRSNPHPTQRQEIDSAVSQTERKETDTHHVLMKHQGEQHLSGEASPSRDPTSSTSEFPEETCCLRCGLSFWTMIEAKKHQTIRFHKLLLPRSVMESADWQRLRCKICNLKCAMRQSLFKHMVNKHSNKGSVLFHELGYISSRCSLCNKIVTSSRMQHHFQRHKMKFVKEINEKSLLTHSVELCIVCNREYSNRKHLLKHMQRHTHADIFTPQASKASPIINRRKCSVGSSPKREEDQRLGSSVERVAASNKVGSCKLCGKQVTHIKYHSLHFKLAHKEYDPQSWKDWFIPLQESFPTKTVTSSKQLRTAFQKYRCKLCHRAFFRHLSSFANHFRRSHDDIDPERREEFLEKCKVTELLKENDDFEMQSSQYVRSILKSSGKPQFPETVFSNKTTKSQPKIFSCKVCSKQFSELRIFKIHFKNAHRKYKVANWEDVFNVIGTAHPDSTNTEAAKSFKCRQSATETLKLEHASTDSDVQNDSLPSISKKTALLQPLGSCKLCHKKFKNLSFFKFHLKKYHSKFAPEDQKNFFKAVTHSHHGEDFKNCDNEDTASFTSVKYQKQNISYPVKSKADVSVSRFKILLSECCLCQATFRDVSLYQVHLRTHLKPCSIKLEDIHSQLIPGIAKNCIDTQLQIQDSVDKDIVITDERSDDGCLYPDSTSEDAKSVQNRILDKKSRFECMPTPAVYSSCLEFSTKDQLKNSAGDCDFTNTERPKTNQGDSVTNESCVDFVIGSSQSGLSAASDKNDCVISESGLLDMFSDEENMSNKDNRSEMAGSTFGDIVHSIVDTLLDDCLIDHSNGKSEAEAISMTGNSSTELQFNKTSSDVTNIGLKRKAHEAGLDQELCYEQNLSQVTFCKDQVTNDVSHVSESDSWETKTAHEVDPDEGQNLELQGHEVNCETLQMSDTVVAEEQAINEPSHISENTCEMREVNEVDSDEVQSIENQSCEMSGGTQLSTVCKDDPVSCEGDLVIDKPSDTDKEDWGKKASEIDKDNGESSEFCESNLTDHSNEKSEAGAVSVIGNSSTEPQFNHTSSDVTNLGLKRKAHEAGLDQEQCSEIKRRNLSQETYCKDQVTDDSLRVSGSYSCEMETTHEVDPDEGQNLEPQGHAISFETVQLSDTVGAEEQAIKEPSHISENACEMKKVNEVDSDEVQSIENQSCEMSCETQFSTVFKDDPVSCEDDLVIDKPSDPDKEDWGKKANEIDKDNEESSEFCESNLTDHSNEKSEAEAVSVIGNSSTEPQFNHTSSDVTNLGLKRKVHEAGLDQEQCSEIKRHNLSQETFCKGQVTNDSGSDSCETKTTREVDPGEGQNLELQGHAISCETLQLSDTVVAEEQAINEQSHISENTCEMREVDEVDFDEVQSIENQNCEMSCGTQLSTVCKDDPVSCENDLVIDKPSDADKEDWGKKTCGIDKDNGESSEFSKSNLMHDTYG